MLSGVITLIPDTILKERPQAGFLKRRGGGF